MSGYKIVRILEESISLAPTRHTIILYAFVCAGIALIAVALGGKYGIISYPPSLIYLFLGFGLLFAAGAAIFIIQKTPDEIRIDKAGQKVVFREGKYEFSLPFSEFTGILISSKIRESDRSSSETRQLWLKRRNGSHLPLSESSNREEIRKEADTISRYLDIDIYSGAELIRKGGTVYESRESILPDPTSGTIAITSGPGSVTYRWNGRKSIASLALLGLVIAGFNIAIFLWALPSARGFTLGIIVGSVIMAVLNLVFLYTFIYNLLGYNQVTLSTESFTYSQHLLGKTLQSSSRPLSDIASFQSEFAAGKNSITVLTHRGRELFDSLMKRSQEGRPGDNAGMMEIVGFIMDMRSNAIDIDGSALNYSEKLFLEREWSRITGLP
jgi:hypothetical protein